MIKTPLKYNISSWEQLVQCQSNYSTSLHIEVRKIIQNRRLTGTIIDVVDEMIGSLFCYLVEAKGPLLVSDNPLDYELTCADLLKQLERFGFFVTFECEKYLPAGQIELLETVNRLRFDKIRILDVYSYTRTGVKESKSHLVVFNIEQNPRWIDNKYSATIQEYTKSLTEGSAFDLNTLNDCSKYHWDWLTFVGDIDDILKDCAAGNSTDDNSEDMIN